MDIRSFTPQTMQATASPNAAKAKKLLIVIDTLAIGSGAEKVAATLGSELTARGFQVHVLTLYEAEQQYPYHGIYHSAKEEPSASFVQSVWRLPHRVRLIQRYAKIQKIDLAITFSPGASFYTLLAKLFGLRTLPVVVAVSGNVQQRGWWFKLLATFIYPFAAKVVSATQTAEEVLRYNHRLKHTTTIYQPLDLEVLDAKKQQPLPVEFARYFRQHPVCISVGHWLPPKGQWHLLRAFTAVRETHPNARLVFVGEGELGARLKTLRDNCGLQERVYFVAPPKNVYPLLAAADVFVSGSVREPSHYELLRALVAGLPLVIPDSPGGAREIVAPGVAAREVLQYPYVTKAGMVTTPQTDEAIWQAPHIVPLLPAEKDLAAAISQVLSTQAASGWPLPNELRQPYSLPTVIDKWETVIQQILSHR